MIYFAPLKEREEWDWFSSRTSVLMCEDFGGIVARNEDGAIQAVCVADTFSVDACSVHFAIDNPLVIRHGFLNHIADWLFVQRGRARIFGLVPSNNEKALKLDKHIGFEEVAVIPQALAHDVDYVVLCLTKEKCRWITKKEEAA